MKKVLTSFALVMGLMFTSSFTTTNQEDALLRRDPVAYTVIEYTKNGVQHSVIVHAVLDCNSLNGENVDSIDGCWHF